MIGAPGYQRARRAVYGYGSDTEGGADQGVGGSDNDNAGSSKSEGTPSVDNRTFTDKALDWLGLGPMDDPAVTAAKAFVSIAQAAIPGANILGKAVDVARRMGLDVQPATPGDQAATGSAPASYVGAYSPYSNPPADPFAEADYATSSADLSPVWSGTTAPSVGPYAGSASLVAPGASVAALGAPQASQAADPYQAAPEESKNGLGVGLVLVATLIGLVTA